MVKSLRIQTAYQEEADGVDDDGFDRFFDSHGCSTVADMTASLGLPGFTLARGDFVYEEDHVFGLDGGGSVDDDLFGDAPPDLA